jgi:hypothetical protein
MARYLDPNLNKSSVTTPPMMDRAWVPLIITLEDLRSVLTCWEQKTARIRQANHEWIAEMWAYNLCASEVGIRHRYADTLQVLPPAAHGSPAQPHFYHYAYPLQVGSARTWDKHAFLDKALGVPGPIELPPSSASTPIPPGVHSFVEVFNRAQATCGKYRAHDWHKLGV